MDVAGAIGFTAIFPMVIGFILSLCGAFYYDDISGSPDMHERRVLARFLVPGFGFILIAVISWIVAIWLGYAQAVT